MPAFAFCQRPDGRFERIGPEVEALTGVPPERWQTEKDLLTRLAEDPAALQRQIEASASSREGVVHTLRLRREGDGRLATVMECRRAVLDKAGQVHAFEGYWIDLTRLELAERRLATAAWAQALSPVTMGLAHDFNNALTGILSLSEFFLSQTDAQHPFHEGLGLIKQNTHQAARLAHQLMRIHHDKPGERSCRDLNTLVGDFMDLLRRVVPKRIGLTHQCCATPLPVKVDAVEFQQIVLHLVLNAVAVLPDRGAIHIETSLHASPPNLSHSSGGKLHGAQACLAVSDTGPGIEPAHLPRIFDPFFTTKPPEQASGLGLHLAGQFAGRHGGTISVESELGKGSTFRVWLPFVKLE